MTIIATAMGPDGTWIGSDGLSMKGDNRVVSRSCDKWNVSPDGEWAFAGSGAITYDALLLEDSPWPDGSDDDPEAQLLGMAAAMRKAIDSAPGAKAVRDDDEVFSCYQFSPVVATPGHVWRLNSDLRSFDPALEGVYQAAGAGVDYAIGAMSALLARGETSAEVLVRTAVETACRVSTLCGGDIFVRRLGACRESAPC